MAFLIDSDWTIDHLSNVPEAVELVDQLASDRLFISLITYLEAYEGTLRSSNQAGAQATLDRFIEAVPVLDLSMAVARRCAHIRNDLRGRNRRIASPVPTTFSSPPRRSSTTLRW